MNSAMRVVVIVSPDRSDLYFANQLMKRANVVGVVVENQTPVRDQAPLIKRSLKYLSTPDVFFKKAVGLLTHSYQQRFADYKKPENAADFGVEGRALLPKPDVNVLYTQGVRAINEPAYVAWIESMKPDLIAVCGASILRDDLLSLPRYGVLNLHGGLSQRYRGLFTTDWAVHNDEPEYVGATVHFVSPGIDDGDLVYQGRPPVEPDDNPHSLYVKLVKLGVTMMAQAIDDISAGQCRRVALRHKGQLCLEHEYDSAARSRTWKKVRQGSIRRYINNKSERDKSVNAMMTNIHPDSV